MAGILRGEFYWADLNPVRGREQAGQRPVTDSQQRSVQPAVWHGDCHAVTSKEQKAAFPLTFPLPPEKLTKPSWVKLSQIRTISVERLGRRMGSLADEDLAHIVDGLIELIT